MADNVELATGYVSLAVSTRGVGREIDRVFSGAGRSADEAGRDAGRRFGNKLTQGVRPAFTGKGVFAGSANAADKAGRDSGKRFGAGFGSTVKGIIGAAVVLEAGKKIAEGLTESIGLASDLGETQSKVNVIFGKEASKALDQFSEGSAKRLGQTKQSVLDAASTFGVFGKSAGLGGKDLANFSTDFVQLSSDLASFHNASPEETIEALGAALRGESEPMRRFGVLLDDASLRQEALRQGLVKTTKDALTPQQKVLAAQALIMKQTKDAQGDFARTSGGLANQQRILNAQFEEGKTKLGEAFLPAALTVVTTLNTKLFPALERIVKGFKGVYDFVVKGDFTKNFRQAFNLAEDDPIVDKLFDIREAVVAFWQQAKPKLIEVGGAIRTGIVAAGGFIKRDVIPAVQSLAGAYGRFVATVLPIVLRVGGAIRDAFIENGPAIRSAFESVKEIVLGVINLIRERISKVTTVINFIWSRWGKNILGVVKSVFGTIIGVISGALKIVSGVIKVVSSAMKGDWKGAWDGIKKIFSGALDIIKAVVKGSMGTVRAIFGEQIEKARIAVRDKINAIQAKFGSIRDWVKGTFKRSWEGLKGILSGPVSDAKTKIDTVLDKIKGSFSTAKTNIKKVWDGVKSVVSSPINWIKNNVYNKPLVPVWNRVAGLVGGKKLSAYASGGIDDDDPYGIRPGYTPGRDTHMIAVSGGEPILRPEVGRAVGKNWVHGINRAARRRGVEGAREFLSSPEGMPGYAGGGIVDWFKRTAGGAVQTAQGIAGKVKSWAVGGLKKAADAIFAPVRNALRSRLTGNGVDTTVRDIGLKALSNVLSKIGVEDKKEASQGGGATRLAGNGLVSWRGGRFTANFAAHLAKAYAQRHFSIFQGGWRPRTSYSGTSHAGDAVDVGPASVAVRNALRKNGLYAWIRTPAQGNWPYHIHGIPKPGAGKARGSAVWQQKDAARGGNGLYTGGFVPEFQKQINAVSVPVRKFDSGGFLPPRSATLAVNGTDKYEKVGFGDGPMIGQLVMQSNGNTRADIDDVVWELKKFRRDGTDYRGGTP